MFESIPLETFTDQSSHSPSLVPKQNKFSSDQPNIQQFNNQEVLLYPKRMVRSAIMIQLPQEELALPPQPIIQCHFDVFSDGVTYQRFCAKLYQHFIILNTEDKLQTEQYIIHFTFDLTFELLRLNFEEKKRWSLTDCYAIRFEKKQKYLELKKPQDNTHFPIWRDHLKNKLNQRGFHEQFYPLKELGKGAYANVYKIKSHQNKQVYAVKAFNKEEAYSEEHGKESVINEIQVMRCLNHQNLMKIQSVYQSKNSLYICVELLAGGQLFDKIHWGQKFNPDQLKIIMKSILAGLQALHSKGFMHRDLKPQNILFREQGSFQCVIADFGLAQKANFKLMFVRCGTPGYVAPEVANLKDHNATYGCECDMFSLGVIFHILLLGKSPFPGKNFDQVLQQNKLCRLHFQSPVYKKLTASELDLLKRLLEKDPRIRITVNEAINHQYFAKPILKEQIKEQLMTELHQIAENIRIKKVPKVKVNISKNEIDSKDCLSPLMLSKKIQRKNQEINRQDSCLKFKRKENILAGKEQQKSRKIQSIKNPLQEQKQKKIVESRFKHASKNQNINS